MALKKARERPFCMRGTFSKRVFRGDLRGNQRPPTPSNTRISKSKDRARETRKSLISNLHLIHWNSVRIRNVPHFLLIYFTVPPEIIDAESSPSTVNIRENYNASLICKATGTPEPKITWKREDGKKIVIKRKKNNGRKGKLVLTVELNLE